MITLTNPTGRNTKAHVVTIGEREYFFSYETCIAFRGYTSPKKCPNCGHSERFLYESRWQCHECLKPLPEKLQQLRLPNLWGPTTGRHFKELGCANFKTLSEEDFNSIVEASLD